MIVTPWGGRVHFRATTSSTMDEAQGLEDAGEPEGSLVWAAHQSAGRGRHPGRRWQAEPGQALLFTVYWDPSRFRRPEFAASLTVGLGVCLWLESLEPCLPEPIRLKWPNDVYLGDRKLAGILVRRRMAAGVLGRWHVGIGMNLLPPNRGLEYRTPPVSLAEAGHTLAAADALQGLLPLLAQALQHEDPRTACAQRLYQRGQTLALTLPSGEVVEGQPEDLDPLGGLVWVREGTRQIVSSAE